MRHLLLALAAAAVVWTMRPALAQEAGERFRDCPECPEMVVLPEGSFIMGSPAWEGAHREHETPARRIGIGRRPRDRRSRSDLRGMGRLPRRRRLRRLQPLRALGPGPAARRPCVVARCEGLCRMAGAPDGPGLPPADGSGMGICRPRRHGGSVSHRRQARPGPGELRRWRDEAGRVLSAQRLRPPRHARQCVGVGRGLLEPEPCRCARGRERAAFRATATGGCCAAAPG